MLKKYFVTLNSVFGLPKFYKKVEVLTNQQKNTFNIVIDGKRLKSASKYIIDIPIQKLAIEIANELNSISHYNINDLPLLNLSKTAVELENDEGLRKYFIDYVIDHFKNDVIFNRANPDSEIEIEQEKFSNKFIIYLENCLSKKLSKNYSGKELCFEESDYKFLKEHISNIDNWSLAALENITNITKSSCLSFGILNNKYEINELKNISLTEKKYNARLFGKEGEEREEISDQILNEIVKTKLFYSFINDKT